MATKKENKKLEKTTAPMQKVVAKNAPKATVEKEKEPAKKVVAPSNKKADTVKAEKKATTSKMVVSHSNHASDTTEVVIGATKSNTKNLDKILELKNITKTFLGGKIIANNDISLDFARNEVHAIVGENGSGKSTLMNIIFGLYKQDKGTILLNNKKVDMYQSGAAKKHKIGMVHQHFHLVDAFTVLENVILGQEELTKTRIERRKIKEYKQELKDIKAELRALRKLDTMIIVHKKTGAKTRETDINFVAAVLKVLNMRHKAFIEIIKEENMVRELKTERARLSIHNKHHQQRIEEINDLILDRKDVISEEQHALELAFTYEHSTQNPDQDRVVELAERQFFLTRELHLLDVHLTGKFGKIKHKEVLHRLREIQIKYNIHIDPFAKVSTLAVGQRQMVEILKVLWEEKDIIVFDEPTATLSVVEIQALLETIDALKKEGKTIIFISHKLKEVKAISDRVTVLRKGVMMGTYDNDDKLTPADIGKLMVGKTIELDYPKRKINDRPLLKFENVSYRTSTGFKAVDDVSFEIHEGEIFGLAGIEGNGQEELLKILTNLRKPYKGSISLMREVDKNEAKHLMKINAQIEHDKILRDADKKIEELEPKFLEKQIRYESKMKIRAAKMEALDLRSEIIAIEGKEGKNEIHAVNREFKKTVHEIIREEHKAIHELHSHKNMKAIHKQIKEIHRVAKEESKRVITVAHDRIKKKDYQTILWDRLTDHEIGYHLSDLDRRLIQSHVPIDRLKHGVVPMKNLEFNAKISDFDTKAFKNFTKEQKEEIAKENDKLYEEILIQKQEKLVIIENEIKSLEEKITSITDNKLLKEAQNILKKLNNKKKSIELRIKNHDADKAQNLQKMNNPIYAFTEKIINGMKVDGAFNHQVELRNLSGGNQQKFVVGREIFRDHKVFVAGHPTRGLDISAIDHIYKTMIENSAGKATLLYSLEINELMAVCDRLAIMYHGKIVDIIDPKKTSLEEVSRMMIGEVE